MKYFLIIIAFLISFKTEAYDCSKVKAFTPSGPQTVKVTVSRYVWSQGIPDYEDVCSLSTSILSFDVRGREEEAYNCLKPSFAEVVTCETKLNGEDAEVNVLPASWIRSWSGGSAREYRFHAYVVKKNNPDFYYDLFSRSLLFDLNSQDLVVEGSLRTGPGNPEDGFWIRAEFQR